MEFQIKVTYFYSGQLLSKIITTNGWWDLQNQFALNNMYDVLSVERVATEKVVN